MKKRAVLNFAASTVYQILNLLVGLIVPKFYTEAFGSAYNGLNQSVSQIMSLLSVLQFGISAASIQMMFRYIAENDEKMISAVYWDTGRQYRLMGYAFVALIIPIAMVFPYAIQSDGVSYYVIVAFLLFRAISSAMEYFFQAKYGVIMVAHNLSYVVYCINSVLLLLGTALHLLVIFTGRNILVYQAVALVTTLVRLVIVSGYVRKKFPYLHHYKRQKGLTEKGSKRKDVMVSEIAGMVIDSTDLLVLSAFSGLVAASVYSVYNFVTAGLGNVLGSCREAVFAGIGRTYYADREAFKRKISEFESIYFFLAFFSST